MSSQLNVDTIVDKAGSGGTNVKIANTSVTVGEGGSGTTNTVQGLTKAWVQSDSDATLDEGDSFNTSSATDRDTGRYEFNRTNNMVNLLYVCSGSAAGSNGDGGSTFVTGNFFDFQVQGPYSTSASSSGIADASFTDGAYVANIVHGDLA